MNMSIFDNQITPEPPKGSSWNKIGWNLFLHSYYRNLHGEYMYQWGENGFKRIEITEDTLLPFGKHNVEQLLENMKRLSDRILFALKEMETTSYNKYGVWLKWKVLKKKNGRIKTISFYKYC